MKQMSIHACVSLYQFSYFCLYKVTNSKEFIFVLIVLICFRWRQTELIRKAFRFINY